MAGGIGSRFWPASRTNQPKQFLDILGTGKTLIQQTYQRFLKICPRENIYILTHESYIEQIKQQIPEIKDEQILAEPARKNTAPCIAYAAMKINQINTNANIIVAPSDHVILQEDEFVRIANNALDFCANNDALATLGIQPSRPDTGYGYIQYIDDGKNEGVYKVKTFTEKPKLEVAKRFLESGDFLWNAGIFIWSTKSILSAFEHYLDEVYEAFADAKQYLGTADEPKAIEQAFITCPNISIDFGIMEKADNVYVFPADFGWSDLGTWASLYEEKEKDYLQNAVNGKNVVVYNASNNMISVPDDKLVVLNGLEDFIVVDTNDVLLICKKQDEQSIKEITHDIKMKKGNQYL